VAHSGRATRADECLLWREERTWGAYDPKRTLEISGSAQLTLRFLARRFASNIAGD
jgi:hypothetical protein